MQKKVFKIRMKQGEDPKSHKDFRVRRFHIQSWLNFLKRYNPLYSDVGVCDESINALPEDDSCYEELKSLTVVVSDLIKT